MEMRNDNSCMYDCNDGCMCCGDEICGSTSFEKWGGGN